MRAAGSLMQGRNEWPRAARRIPFQNFVKVTNERFAILGSVHAIDGLLRQVAVVGVGLVAVGRLSLPLGGG